MAGVLAVLLLGGAGYAWADAADLVPGTLTTRPAPAPRQPVPYPDVAAPDVPPAATQRPQPPAVDGAALAARIDPLLADPALGPAVSVSVRDLQTGELVHGRAEATPRVPASTTKLLTAAAALEVLGAEAVLSTTTGWLPGAGRPGGRPAVVLTGAGDVLLGAGASDLASVAGRAGLADLAEATARSLLAAGLLDGQGFDVVVDDSLLGGSPVPGRPPGDLRFSIPPASLAVDVGRTGAGTGPRDGDPAGSAGRGFATALNASIAGLAPAQASAVAPVAVSRVPVPTGTPLASLDSAPVAEIIRYFLSTSENSVADAMAGTVAARLGRPTDLASAGAVVAGLAGAALGVQAPVATLADGSGLSAGSLMSADTVSGVLALAAAQDDDRRLLPSLLPVAGLDGTVAGRFDADGPAAAARGVARPKTGTLTGVTSLAGVVTTADGRGLAFAVLADAVPVGGTEPARDAVDRVAAAIATCC